MIEIINNIFYSGSWVKLVLEPNIPIASQIRNYIWAKYQCVAKLN